MSAKYTYLFPFEKILKGSHIIIYGAGDVGQEYLQQMKMTGYCDVIAFIDRAYDKYPSMIIPVYPVEKVGELSFDYVLLAFKMGAHVSAVTKVLLSYGIEVDKIIYIEPRKAVDVLVVSVGDLQTQLHDYAYLHNGISIALKYGAGLGDAIVKKKLFTELVSMAPDCNIDIYSPGVGGIIRSIYSDQENLNAIIEDGGALYAREMSHYDMAVTVSFMIDLDVLNQERLKAKNPIFTEKMRTLQEKVNEYNLSATGVTSRYVHFNRMKFLGLNYYNYLNYTGVFDIKDYFVTIPLDEMYRTEYEKLVLLGKYITVNYGSGVDASSRDNGVAKDWPIAHVEKFVKLFKDKYPNIKVVQVGSAGTLSIDGVDEYFLGENLELVKYILKGSMLHVDKEGGLVHLATQLGTKCVVCFGPTPLEYFGYNENINILAGECHGCHCLYDGFDVCARGMEKPECMWGITAEMVMDKVKNILKINKRLVFQMNVSASNVWNLKCLETGLIVYCNVEKSIRKAFNYFEKKHYDVLEKIKRCPINIIFTEEFLDSTNTICREQRTSPANAAYIPAWQTENIDGSKYVDYIIINVKKFYKDESKSVSELELESRIVHELSHYYDDKFWPNKILEGFEHHIIKENTLIYLIGYSEMRSRYYQECYCFDKCLDEKIQREIIKKSLKIDNIENKIENSKKIFYEIAHEWGIIKFLESHTDMLSDEENAKMRKKKEIIKKFRYLNGLEDKLMDVPLSRDELLDWYQYLNEHCD